MRKSIKNTISIILAITCLTSLFMFSSSPVRSNALEIQPMYIACPIGPGQCKMLPRGGAWVSVNGVLQFTGFTHQCSQCNMAILADIDHGFGYLGSYYQFNPSYTLGLGGTSITVNASDISYNSSIANDPFLSDLLWY